MAVDCFLSLIMLSEVRGVKKGTNLLQAAVDAAGVAGKKGKIWSEGKPGDAVKNAFEHFREHGSDFDDVNNSVQYVNKAHEFLNNPPSGVLTKTRRNGDALIYDQQTNTLGVKTADGTPKTLFKPKAGIKYWERQFR